MATRSAQLATGVTASGGDNFVYTCPADVTTLVKSLYWWNLTGSSVSPLLLVQSLGSVRTWLFQDGSVANGDFRAHDPIWFVMQPGDQLDVFCGLTGIMYFISGAELDGTA
jgi:hypothetical protein